MFDSVDTSKLPSALNDLSKSFQGWMAYVGIVALSLWGGVVRFLQSKETFSWRSLMAQLSSSSFAGLMVYFGCQYANLNGPLTGAACGMASYMGTPAIIALAMRLKVVKNFLTVEAK